MLRFLLALPVALLLTSHAHAHYNILLPDAAAAKKGDKVTFTYQWGHPFEHEMFDAPPPARVFVMTPDGKKSELAKSLEKFKKPAADKKHVQAFRFTFVPEQRGDHTFFLHTPPIFLEDSKEFVQDIVRVALHVGSQKAWDADPGRQFKIIPVTRPYGLYPGMVFQARALLDQSPGEVTETAPPHKNALVEFERYNPAPPKEVPGDELITFRTRTDQNGLVTVAFPDPGWWSLTTQRDAGTRELDGTKYPLRQRVTLWLHVDPKKE